jgi:hypothetical protein
MLLAKTPEIRNVFQPFPLAKPQQKVKAILKTYKLFIHGNMAYIINSF